MKVIEYVQSAPVEHRVSDGEGEMADSANGIQYDVNTSTFLNFTSHYQC